MSLFNQNWIGFDGTPVTGKVPPRTVIHAAPGVVLTPTQESAVAHAFKLFTDAVKVSPHVGMYHTQHRKLADGTKVRMVSNGGVEVVEVWPVGGPENGVVADFFLAIPASSTFPNGFGGQIIRWKRYTKTDLPTEPNAFQATEDHPGHITWSSVYFKNDLGEIQLSWRGPDSRYSSSTGWTTVTGGSLSTSHESGAFIGPDHITHKDTSTVWIGGRAINTGISKVIAAALHRPDPETNPGHVVLRVCTDNYPQPSTTRAFAVYDLVVDGIDPEDCTLDKLLKNEETLVVKDVYPATNYKADASGSDAGKWVDAQRPHFDSKGARLALVIKEPAAGTFSFNHIGAVFALPGWGLTRVNIPCSRSGSSTSSETAESSSSSATLRGMVAIDFLHSLSADGGDDDVVHLIVKIVSTGSGSSSWVSEGDGRLTASAVSSSTATTTVEHSMHGVLLSHTDTFTSSSNAEREPSVEGEDSVITGSYTYSARNLPGITFAGDLSRDAFVVGSTIQTNAGVSSGTMTGEMFFTGGVFAVGFDLVAEAYSVAAASYDVFFDATVIASGVSAGAAASGEFPARTDVFVGVIRTPTPGSSDTSESSDYGLSADLSNMVNTSALYNHAAVDPTRRVAYFGVEGLNIIARNLAPGSLGDAITQVPDYFFSDIVETMAAPIFLGTVQIIESTP